MRRFLLAGLAALLLWVAPVLAQAPAPTQGPTAPPSTAPSTPVNPNEQNLALPYAVAVVFSIVILVIVCMPSRKN
jgi:hypothetical protein